ncbi:hypothetical protein WJX72_009878 [[Myrmecia] bisecta]|uniref:F-box domain-containing protein n=1 Tax=[Myrmecia] bisecta TaxID=41462 RepID=A0AAW1R991_9CHLO
MHNPFEMLPDELVLEILERLTFATKRSGSPGQAGRAWAQPALCPTRVALLTATLSHLKVLHLTKPHHLGWDARSKRVLSFC